MAQQRLELRRDMPIVIETPEGLIRITKPANSRHRGKIDIELPGDSKAYVGEERALEHARFVTTTTDGRTVPTYGVLIPVRGKDGALLGVRSQTPLRVAESAPAPTGAVKIAQA